MQQPELSHREERSWQALQLVFYSTASLTASDGDNNNPESQGGAFTV